MGRSLVRIVVASAALALVLAACGGTGPTGGGGQGAATATPAATRAAGGATATPNQAGGSGNRGYDCATLISPAELDQIAGFTGGTVSTTSRGDQNSGEPGYGECAFDEPAASIWSGTISIATGDALDGFNIQYDFNKEHGGTAEPGLGTDAILVRTDAGTTIFAKGANGVGVTVSLSWDTSETASDKAVLQMRQIAETVLDRAK